jgi:hypothetical protein
MRLVCVVVFALVCAVGCGGSGRGPGSPSRPLPAWTGHATQLFDDAIDMRAVGLDLERAAPSARGDALLRERAQTGDAVLRVRVDTVTARDDGVEARYDLGLRTLEKIAGENPPPEAFTVRIGKESPSAGLMRGFQTRLGGKTFVAFVREFVRADGDTDLHFHLSADDKEVVGAVKEAVASADFK